MPGGGRGGRRGLGPSGLRGDVVVQEVGESAEVGQAREVEEVGEQSGAGSVGCATSKFLASEGGVSEQLCWREA